MIREDKFQNAAYALNTALVLARDLAHESAPGNLLASVLDVLEYLPRLMAAPHDATAEYREHLESLVRLHGSFGLALSRFDAPAPARW